MNSPGVTAFASFEPAALRSVAAEKSSAAIEIVKTVLLSNFMPVYLTAGSYHWLHIVYKPLWDSNGLPPELFKGSDPR